MSRHIGYWHDDRWQPWCEVFSSVNFPRIAVNQPFDGSCQDCLALAIEELSMPECGAAPSAFLRRDCLRRNVPSPGLATCRDARFGAAGRLMPAYGPPGNLIMHSTVDHLYLNCPALLRTCRDQEPHQLGLDGTAEIDPLGTDVCGWCVRVWKARNQVGPQRVNARPLDRPSERR